MKSMESLINATLQVMRGQRSTSVITEETIQEDSLTREEVLDIVEQLSEEDFEELLESVKSSPAFQDAVKKGKGSSRTNSAVTGSVKYGGEHHPNDRIPMKHYGEFKKDFPNAQVRFRGPRRGKSGTTRKGVATHFSVYSFDKKFKPSSPD